MKNYFYSMTNQTFILLPIDRMTEELLATIEQLKEENKKLRDYADNLDSENDNQAIEIEELKKENKKLKEEISSLRIELVQEKWRTGKKWTPSTPYI